MIFLWWFGIDNFNITGNKTIKKYIFNGELYYFSNLRWSNKEINNL